MSGRARSARAAILVSLSLAAASQRARAQDADDVDFLARRAADRCRHGEYERALELFRQALDHGRTPRALGEMGACELRVTRWTDAETHLAAALALPDDAWLRRHRAEVEGRLAEARSHVGRLQLIGGVPGATVRVGDREVGTLPLAEPVIVAPGVTAVEVSAPGHRTWRRSIDVPGGGTTQESVSLERDVPLEPSVAVAAPPVCSPGSVLRRGLCYATEDGPVARRGVRPWQAATWVGVGVAVAAGASALGLGVAGASVESDYLQRCGGVGAPPACASDRMSTQAELDDRARVVNGFVGVAAVGAALAVASIIFDHAAPRGRAVALGPSGVGVRW